MPQFSKATRSLLPRGAALFQRVDDGVAISNKGVGLVFEQLVEVVLNDGCITRWYAVGLHCHNGGGHAGV